MESVYNTYLGKVNAKKAKGTTSQKIKKYFNETVGEFLLEQFTSLDILFERIFKGFERGGKIMSLSGVSAVKRGKSTAKAMNDAIVDEYFNKFYKLEPRGQAFNTMYNTVERGMLAYMMRSVIGTEEEVKAEFDRRKQLIVDSIKALEKGDKNHMKLAIEYAKVFNKILQNSETSEEVFLSASSINSDAVKFWQDQWANKYDQLSDLSENIYNQTLGKDVNYTPDRVSSIEEGAKPGEQPDEMDTHLMTFHANNNTAYQRRTGVLMTPVMDDTLPKKSYINLTFDSNNANSMYDALVDLNTAGPIRQVSAFFNSPEFDEIIPDLTDRGILRRRVNLFIRNIRNKNPYENDSFAKAIRALQNVAALGTGQILAGPTQIPKQTIPVILNTIINAGGIDLTAPFNEDKNNFINRSGYSIAYRSAASQNQIATMSKIASRAESGVVGKAGDAILALNDLQLKYFLQKPDAYVARASWMSYYEKSLKKQGIDPKTIDYATHEVNETAADYAQRMVDRQQNVSDMDLAGKFIASKQPAVQLINKLLLPFASFRINQSARLGSDWATLTSKVSTKEDKAIAARSLGGFFTELVTFRAVSIGVSSLLGSMALSFAGKKDDEEDRERKRSTIVKGATTSTIVDTFSLLPAFDPIFQSGVALGLDVVQDLFNVAEKNRVPFYDAKEKDFIEQAGTLGISLGRARQFFELASLAYTGQYTDEYSGKTKYIKNRDADALKLFVVPLLLSNLGMFPAAPEIGTMARIIMKDVKKDSSTVRGGYKADEMTMEDMKKYFPEQYEELYGKGSPYRDAQEAKKEADKEKNKEEEELKEAMYGKPASKGRGKGRGESSRGSSSRGRGRR
jgi:DNA-binding XRE family transcriptional regulator